MKKVVIAAAILLAVWGFLECLGDTIDPHPERYVE